MKDVKYFVGLVSDDGFFEIVSQTDSTITIASTDKFDGQNDGCFYVTDKDEDVAPYSVAMENNEGQVYAEVEISPSSEKVLGYSDKLGLQETKPDPDEFLWSYESLFDLTKGKEWPAEGNA